MEDIRIGSRVKANRDGRSMSAGEIGDVIDVICLDSDYYLIVHLDNGKLTTLSAESYWNLYND